MRIHALLSWYSESPSWLAETVASLAGVADRIVAIDGAYALYPDSTERPASGIEQAETILRAAGGARIACTLHRPTEPFYGNEVEKRSLLFTLAEQDASEEDWYFVIDGDEVVTYAAPDLKATLDCLGEDVAEVGLTWTDDRQATGLGRRAEQTNEIRDGFTPVRRLYRALPGLHVEGAHNVYMTFGGAYLNGRSDLHRLEPSAMLTRDLRMEHRHAFRGIARQQDYAQYLRLRDETGAERLHEYEMLGPDGQTIRIKRLM